MLIFVLRQIPFITGMSLAIKIKLDSWLNLPSAFHSVNIYKHWHLIPKPFNATLIHWLQISANYQ